MWKKESSTLIVVFLLLIAELLLLAHSTSAIDYEGCFGEYVSFQIETRFTTCKDNVRYSVDPDGDSLPYSLTLDPVTGWVTGVFRADWTGYGDIGQGSRQLQTGQTYDITFLVENLDDGSVEEVELELYRAECDEPVISNFVIVDTKRNLDVRPLVDDDVIQLGWLQDRFSIRANVYPEVETETFRPEHIVDKVRFWLDGKRIRTESFPPYSLGGDKTGEYNCGDYSPFDISEGKHTLMAIPYGKDGQPGEAKSVTFTIDECYFYDDKYYCD